MTDLLDTRTTGCPPRRGLPDVISYVVNDRATSAAEQVGTRTIVDHTPAEGTMMHNRVVSWPPSASSADQELV